jgi:beta-glucosidase
MTTIEVHMLNRRLFGATLGAGALVAVTSSANASTRAKGFAPKFRWGAATSAYQIEGAVNEDGRGQSIWDVFSHTQGKILNGDTGDVACDSYHRYAEDTQLMKNLGMNSYRFSIAWPRIFPSGRGAPNPKGMDHYKRLVDNLLENGIEPHITLYHWDLPAALEGGWQERSTAYAFADYAGYISDQLSDRVGHFITTNEFQSIVEGGYLGGLHAPGLRLPQAQVRQVGHHAVLAHGLAVQAIRARAKRAVKVGLAENTNSPVPVIETAENIAAARKAMRLMNRWYLTAILEGEYPEDNLTASSKRPTVEAGDMAIIHSPIDFVSLNIYAPTYVRAAPERPSGYAIVSMAKSHPSMGLAWLKMGPEAAYWTPRLVSELWKPKSLFISENGCPSSDILVNGEVNDTDRVMFLRNYISNVQHAVRDGYPVDGYFAWSLLDNFEWAEGYSQRFGIHYVDFATQTRTPKLSALWLREVIKGNVTF